MVTLFRNMWFLCVLFHFTSGEEKGDTAMEWQKPALARIAAKTPSIVLEESHYSIANELEYNSVIRLEYAHLVSRIHHKIRSLSCIRRLSQASNFLNFTHIFAWKRDPLSFPRPDCVLINNARYREHAISCRIAFFASILLHKRYSQQTHWSQSMYGIHRREGKYNVDRLQTTMHRLTCA
jgi:hypothetical protein